MTLSGKYVFPGIKIGRYTHEKRAQDIQEVKHLQREKTMKEAEGKRRKELEAIIDEVRKSKDKNIPGKLARFLLVLPRLRARFQVFILNILSGK